MFIGNTYIAPALINLPGQDGGGGPVSPSNLITEIGMTPPEDNIVTETGTQIVLEA